MINDQIQEIGVSQVRTVGGHLEEALRAFDALAISICYDGWGGLRCSLLSLSFEPYS